MTHHDHGGRRFIQPGDPNDPREHDADKLELADLEKPIADPRHAARQARSAARQELLDELVAEYHRPVPPRPGDPPTICAPAAPVWVGPSTDWTGHGLDPELVDDLGPVSAQDLLDAIALSVAHHRRCAAAAVGVPGPRVSGTGGDS